MLKCLHKIGFYKRKLLHRNITKTFTVKTCEFAIILCQNQRRFSLFPQKKLLDIMNVILNRNLSIYISITSCKKRIIHTEEVIQVSTSITITLGLEGGL